MKRFKTKFASVRALRKFMRTIKGKRAYARTARKYRRR